MNQACLNHVHLILPSLGIYELLFAQLVAGWSSLVARQAHNLKVAGSNPAPAPNQL